MERREAIDRRTGIRIKGTLEKLTGCCGALFELGPDSKPKWKYDDDGTEIFWDSAEAKTDRDGRTIFLDTDGNEVPEEEIEVVVGYRGPGTANDVCPDCHKTDLRTDGQARKTAQKRTPVSARDAHGLECAGCYANLIEASRYPEAAEEKKTE